MKRFLLMIVLSIICVVFCGAPEAPAPTTPTTGKDASSIAYEALSEAELVQLIKVLPVAKTEIEKSGMELESDADNLEGALGELALMNTKVAGLNAKLTAAGMPWDKFWPAMAKTWMAMIAVTFSEQMGDVDKSMKEMQAQLNDPKIPAAQKDMMKTAMEAMTQVKTIYDKVPQGNRDLVKKHWDELEKIMEIED